MITIVELPEYIKQAEKIFSASLRESLINYLAAHPRAGVVMEGTHGIRKFRWKREGTGKSGGARVIYYYYNDDYPLFLITVFKKGKKANLTKQERNELAKLVDILIATYGGKS
ncbi:MAG TPA: addiction module toxin RelE [Desulfobulbus sp.]|nr:addiction module toxin RelE [Desulfobulbus sp.]